MASIEFERAIFHEIDNNKIARCKYYKSLCYKEIGDKHRALEELSEINIFNLPDSLFFVIRYEQAVCNFLNNDPTQALWNLEEIRYRFPDSLNTLNILPLNILCLNATRNWDKAFDTWNYLLNHTRLKDSEKNDFEAKISRLYNKRKTPAFYSEKKAENLSRFIPGAGQMYCGAVFEGTFNLIMNAALLGYSFFEFYSKYYFTGYFVGLGIFNKTYNGGMHRAKLLADEKNMEGINKFNVETSALLIRILDSQPLEKSLQKVLYKDQIRNFVSLK
jgi:TM2 domain-containing membrane protein YozV